MANKYFDWIKILGVVGVGLALFLLWERYFQPTFQPCNINATINCDAVINGQVANTFGIPTPLIGLLGYLVILFAAFKRNPRLVWGMATFGLAFCLYIAFIELFKLHVVCPVCIACQLDMITVFILGFLLNKNKNESAT
jgi:uncharacterized membrane protein